MFFSRWALLAWQWRRAPRHRTWSLADREVVAALGEGPMTAIEFLTAIGGTKSLSTLDGFARTVWQRWGAKEVTDEQGPGAGGGDRGPQARGARSRHGGATGAACGGAGEGAGEAEPFSAKAEGDALARPAGVD